MFYTIALLDDKFRIPVLNERLNRKSIICLFCVKLLDLLLSISVDFFFHCTYHSRNLLCFEMSEENVIKIELKDRKYIRIEPTVTTDEGNPLFFTKLNVVESTECTSTKVSRKEYTCLTLFQSSL